MTHPVPCLESSPTPSHMHMPSVKTVIYVPSMTIFQNKSFLFYKLNQNPLDKLQYSLVFTKSHVFLWVANIRGLTAGFARLPTLSRTFIAGHICLTNNTGFFTRGGIYPFLLYPNTRIFHFFFLLCDRETHFGLCPILPSPTSNIKHSVNLPCTHDIPSKAKHNFELYHALTPMSCDVPCINAIQCHCMYLMLHAQ